MPTGQEEEEEEDVIDMFEAIDADDLDLLQVRPLVHMVLLSCWSAAAMRMARTM